MKLTSTVDRLESDLNGEEMLICIKFDIDLEICDDNFFNKKRIYIKFDKNGKITHFPNLGDNSYDNPIKYVALGKAVEEILGFEGDRVKNVYDRAMVIYKDYKVKEKALREERNYDELKSKKWSLDTIVSEKIDLLKRARKEEKRILLKEEIDALISERDLFSKDKIEPIALELRKLESSMMKSVAELEI